MRCPGQMLCQINGGTGTGKLIIRHGWMAYISGEEDLLFGFTRDQYISISETAVL